MIFVKSFQILLTSYNRFYYLKKSLGISESRLQSIINKVGDSVATVKKYLGIL